MNKTVLIVSELLQDLNRMKDWFPAGCKIKGASIFASVPAALKKDSPDLVVLKIRSLEDFFLVYESMRNSVNTKDTPLIAIANVVTRGTLRKNVILTNTTLKGESTRDSEMKSIIAGMLEDAEDGQA